MTTREGKAIPFQAVLPTYAAGVQEGDVTPVVIYDQNDNPIGANEPLVYAALVTQTGTNNPVATELRNTTGATISWSRTNAGVYSITASSPVFTADKTVLLALNGDFGSVAAIYAERTSSTVMNVYTYDDTGVRTDGVLVGASVVIEVYP